MSQSSTLLVELLTEELPPTTLTCLSNAFAHGLVDRLAARNLINVTNSASPSFEAFGTPRRLAVMIHKVRAVAPQGQVHKKILPVSIALDTDGRPSVPLIKKLAAVGFPGMSLTKLERAMDGKTEAFFVNYTVPGITLEDGLQAALEETISKLPIPKIMTYQRSDGTSVRFVRPAHQLIALHAHRIVPVRVLGLNSGAVTIGHRFLSQGHIAILHADDYARTLKQRGKVIASIQARKELIRAQLLKCAGVDYVLMPEALLDEVNALVEWPIVYECYFDEAFLHMPQECLILTMQTHQKYFALTDASGKLRSRFLVVSNLQTETPQQIVLGNERVVSARLADAQFFLEQDQKKTLEQHIPMLANVVYHNKLGSQLQRVERLAALAATIAPRLGVDAQRASHAARLAKADLLTEMVGEFPELQGTMGAYYARHDGEPADIILVCSEHYRPRFSGDKLPSTMISSVVALADKLETLVGIWGIGLRPTGEKDPFSLRRYALGVLRIVLEKRLPLDLIALLRYAYAQFATHPRIVDPTNALYNFFIDRLHSLLRDRGYNANEVDAVLSQNPTRIDDIISRLDAVRYFSTLPEAISLASANKRITNILKKSGSTTQRVEKKLLVEPAEQILFEQLHTLTPTVQGRLRLCDYTGALSILASLRDAVDVFFNDVMVNSNDVVLRANRLSLLTQLHKQMNCVADISKLAI
ncbi:glycine--tRNA ligase subunit beta [Candidatus Vallotia cooleyia]|uniref:glycine--tRNA ligase subunit beta n=1 Tax=Candidatus Vallotiella adelgis TaxID=1177211 RepID=UPI001D01CC0C|nr:glycine--tRNA ligase subunit beta [Candidatus Vallotia cooleyia]UDG82490.1 Glycine--tRNA ligase beta subunit [Candidatus Vallotia cooleyia]